jgi:hypothetical protein
VKQRKAWEISKYYEPKWSREMYEQLRELNKARMDSFTLEKSVQERE